MAKETIIETEEERFEMILNALNLTAYKLSEEIDVSVGSLYHVKSGRIKLSSDKYTNLIIGRFPNVSIDFIKNGKLPVLLTDKEALLQSNIVFSKKREDFLKKDLNDKLSEILDEIHNLQKDVKSILIKKSSN